MKFSQVNINHENNLCSFILFSKTKQFANFKIDIYENYFDLFINNEEVVIQNNIVTIGESFRFIEDYLKSNIEEIIVESDKNRLLKNRINFYLPNMKMNSIGSVLPISFLTRKKNKSIVKYEACING
ncbi:hypothetical protein LV84_04299 [Algoriphagus ratkowskyi]|uniref:Uncharacterized protein n=1 Tax=Algoriphagus ratkowskyi TaxID=57028 RepID=A0A2W7SED1_9BACT|nr:hypothetical protein [Algoriphagus ratkowskyi]PZX49032.1 hypothetical protein LV84_04299 [Algoriphagus ratkowskyi]TXD75332.1 hypothetical protein ESW18_20905 [Algoriphagus ratkowskyi]